MSRRPAPTAEELDHLVGHADHRPLTADEHALLRAGIRQLRASLAGAGAAVRRASDSAYHQQVIEQRDKARAGLRDAEDELSAWRRQNRRADRYRAAWQNARSRARRLSIELGEDDGWNDAELHNDQTCEVVQRRDAAEARFAAVEAERDAAYRERAHLTAWLATTHPAVITPAPDIDEPGWQILYLAAGGRQLSWHIAPRDADLYTHVEHVPADDPRAQWDGHTTEQKYQAIRAMTFSQLRGEPTP